jgi:hypothetical protein
MRTLYPACHNGVYMAETLEEAKELLAKIKNDPMQHNTKNIAIYETEMDWDTVVSVTLVREE